MKKFWSILGILGGLALIACGVLVMSGEMGGNASYASEASAFYDSGYASFGGDFYSYVNNNAAEAASAARTTASNVRAVAQLLQNFCGLMLMGFGLFMSCHFGVCCAGCKAPASAAVNPVPVTQPVPAAPVAESLTEVQGGDKT